MDPPPLPPLPTPTATTTPTAITSGSGGGAPNQFSYPDSLESSPRSRNVDSYFDEPLPPVPGAKLRLMCSYGGHIIPRPHDKSLCYVGGETRIVVVDRHSSLSDLCSRLSKTLLNGRAFTLKYQLPSEDLDSLISMTTDEDLENMIEEYDRTAATSPHKPSRLRLFLFFVKPETTASMGALLDDAKSETWFVDALNGSGFLPRGLSDSAVDDCLLSLDGVRGSDSCNDLEAQGNGENIKQVAGNKSNVHEVHYFMSDSPMVESNSSFGSSSTSPSMSNLPPIRVRVDDNGARMADQKMAGIEEQFAQISFAPPTSLPVAMASSGTVVSTAQVNPMVVSGENMNKGGSDEERSDHGAPVGFRKPPLPLQTVQVQPKTASGGGFSHGLPSPDSVASDSSIASSNSLSKPMYYQEQVHGAQREIRGPTSPNTINSDNSDLGSTQVQQPNDSGYVMPPQIDQNLYQQQQQHQQQQQQQQQFVHASTQYIHHPGTGPVPMPSYYPVYAPQAQQQHHHPMDQQYPVYLMSIPQTQHYNMSLQSNMSDAANVIASTHPLASQNPATYKDGIPPMYPTKISSPTLPETTATPSVYKPAITSNPSYVQISPNQYQQQYVGYSQMPHPSQSMVLPSSGGGANYAYEYANPAAPAAHEQQVFYTQHPAAAPPTQYQSMTPAAAAAIALSEAAKQLPTDNNNQQ